LTTDSTIELLLIIIYSVKRYKLIDVTSEALGNDGRVQLHVGLKV